jgi:hypothetical protein
LVVCLSICQAHRRVRVEDVRLGEPAVPEAYGDGKEALDQLSSLDSDLIDDDIESFMLQSGIDKALLYSDDSQM